nr:response regulator [Nitrospirota bacterium]
MIEPEPPASPSVSPVPADQDLRERHVYFEQVNLLYQASRETFLASTINACFLAYVQHEVIASSIVYGWLGYMMLTTVGRLMLVQWYWQAPRPKREAAARRWDRLYLAGTALSALGWGGAGWWLFPDASPAHQAFLAFVVGGMSAAATAVLAPRRLSMITYIGIILVPTAVRFWSVGDAIHQVMGVMTGLYLLVLLGTGARVHRTIRHSLELRYDNEGLIRKMQAEIDHRRQTESALKQSEEQLLQSQKMEAVGKLAGGIAHEFNNILQVIKGYCYFLLPEVSKQEALRRDVEGIDESVDRAAGLTNQLLAFSRRQVIIPRVLDLNAIVVEHHRMLDRLIGESITLEVALAPDLPRVKADPAQIGQVLLNLVNNARDAMPKGGVATIATSQLTLRENAGEAYPGIPRGAYTVLTVRDTGCGMPPEVMERIFEPFFTTKEVGKGTGLGLSTVYGLIAQIGGHIRVASQPRQGTRFTILLPAVEQAAETAGPERPATDLLTGSDTILLVEDEPEVRKLLAATLRAKGYQVLEAEDGQAALRLCHGHVGPVHLAAVDLVMPEMGGRDLIRHLIVRYPNLKVLYMSGYTDEPVDLQELPDSIKAFMQKPFSSEVLLRTVRDLLDGF